MRLDACEASRICGACRRLEGPPGGSSRRFILEVHPEAPLRRFRKFRRFRSSQRFRTCRNLRKFRHFRCFCMDSESDFRRFSRSQRASDSTRKAKGRTFVFAGRRSTFKGSQTSQQSRKSKKIDEKWLGCCFAHEPRDKNLVVPLQDTTWR